MTKHPKSKSMKAPGHPNKSHSSSHHGSTSVAKARGRDTIPGMGMSGTSAAAAKMCPDIKPGVGGNSRGKKGY